MGACCRAMQTMGLKNLILVGAENIDQDEAFMTAVHARKVLDNAAYYTTLPDALAGTVLSAGITRRRGVRRKWFSVLPEELAPNAPLHWRGERHLFSVMNGPA